MRLQRSLLYILFIQALLFCNLGWAKQEMKVISNYDFSDFVSDEDNDYSLITFKDQPYTLELQVAGTNFELATTTVDKNYKLVKRSTSLTSLTGMTKGNVLKSYIDVGFSDSNIFVIFQGTKPDGNMYHYLLSSTDGQTWTMNHTFPLLSENSDSYWYFHESTDDNTVGIVTMDFNGKNLNRTQIVYFSKDNGVSWDNFGLPEGLFITDGPFILNKQFFMNMKPSWSSDKTSLYYTDGKSIPVEVDISALLSHNFKNDKSAKLLDYVEQMFSVDNKLIASAAYSTGKNLLWLSKDHGKTWSPLTEIEGQWLEQLAYHNGQYYMLTTDNHDNTYYYNLTAKQFDAVFVNHTESLKATHTFTDSYSTLLDYKSAVKTFLVINDDIVQFVKI